MPPPSTTFVYPSSNIGDAARAGAVAACISTAAVAAREIVQLAQDQKYVGNALEPPLVLAQGVPLQLRH